MKRRECAVSQSLFITMCLLLAAHNVLAAAETGIPSSICTNDFYECDVEASARWSLFQTASGIARNAKPVLAVGDCSRNGKSRNEVFMLLALSHDSDRVFFNGKIGFFNNFSEYQNTPATHISSVFPDIHDSRNTMSLSESHAYIEFTDRSPTRYWLRHNVMHDRYVMVIYFGFSDTLLCEFQPA